MDRCALFVDAGYLLADGAMAVHGTRHRETVSWDFSGLLQLLSNLARERTGMPLLRCYWYEATVEGRRAPEHDALADLPGLKLRLGRIRPGRREGVDTEIHRDLMTLARNGALADAVVVSGDEDLAQVVSDAQDLGLRVTVVHVAVDGNWTISRVLRQECDDLIEIGAGHLRPYVNLLTGIDTGSGSSAGSGAPALGAGPLSNGHGSNGHGPGGAGAPLGPLQTTAHNGPPPSSPLGGQPPLSPATAGLGSAGPSGSSGSSGGYGGGSGGTGVPTGPLPLPGSGGLGSSSSLGSPSSLGSGGLPLPSSPLQAPPSSAPPAPAPAPASSQPPLGPQYTSSPVPSPSPPPPPQTLPSQTSGPSPLPTSQPHGPYTGPQQIAPVPAQQSTPTLSDAVKAAHQEGQDFGESVARDAPALWLEAVLARKPRMPSDLEARLLQGSSLPIDFLLHDEVRHALRRGFWDALERSRR
ncbi:NYN domain-containing protein [Actinomadura montaniterrae]|uniref:NYN domain-containing protein n=1 Tax=Actinomadura montaniterrae TaxID=1803903 RepID=A0A6L3VVL4_9ACTN|nr:NYN domain-containing protein [Actinomadura montaniterrae]KAB2374564.1 NYN domain-containing protein [Actinomadura montaniterrae]